MGIGLGAILGIGASLLGGLLGGSSKPDFDAGIIPKPEEYTRIPRGLLDYYLSQFFTEEKYKDEKTGEEKTRLVPRFKPRLGYIESVMRATSGGLPQVNVLNSDFITQYDRAISRLSGSYLLPFLERNFQRMMNVEPPKINLYGLELPLWGLVRRELDARRRMLDFFTRGLASVALPAELSSSLLGQFTGARNRALQSALGELAFWQGLYEPALKLGQEAYFPLQTTPIVTPSAGQTLGGALMGIGQGLGQYFLLKDLLAFQNKLNKGGK